MKERTITMVKKTDDKVRINYQTLPDENDLKSKFTLESPDEAAPAFYRALEELSLDVIAILGWPLEWVGNLTVKGAHFSRKDGIMGVQFSCQLNLETSDKITFATPKKVERLTEDEKLDAVPNTINVLSEKTVIKLVKLLQEAEEFIDGKRKYQQDDMFEQDAATAGEKEEKTDSKLAIAEG